jgi:hypothetical protein
MKAVHRRRAVWEKGRLRWRADLGAPVEELLGHNYLMMRDYVGDVRGWPPLLERQAHPAVLLRPGHLPFPAGPRRADHAERARPG